MKKLFASASLGLSYLMLSAQAFAQPVDVNPCPVTGQGSDFSNLCTRNLADANTLPRIITIVIIVAIVIALAFLIWGGIKWILSGGDKGKVEAARGTIIAAIVGLIIIFLSWFILNIVVHFFTGANINQLQLPTL